MSEFGKLRMAMIAKINECGNDTEKIDLVIDCFHDAIIALDWSIDDQIELLLSINRRFKEGHVVKRIDWIVHGIRVNEGL